MTIRFFGTAQRFTAFVLLVAVLTCWLGSSRSAQAQEDSIQPSLSFQGDPLELQYEEGDQWITPKVVVRNASGRSLGLEFSAVLRDSTGELLENEVPVEPEDPPVNVDPYSVTAVDLKMDVAQFEQPSKPLKGFLVVYGTETGGSATTTPEVAPDTLPVTLTKVDPRGPLLKKEYALLWGDPVDTRNWVLIIPFLVSSVVVLGAYFWFYLIPRDKLSRAERWTYAPLYGRNSGLGTGLSFVPTTSWATILTGMAALVAAFVGAQVFPTTRATLTHKDVLVLNLTFVALLFAAPAIYNVIRWRKPDVVKPSEDDKKTQPQVPVVGKEPELKGYTLTMLVASAGILGALLGQLFLVILLIHEIENVDVTDTVRWVLRIVTVAVMAYAAVYVGRGVVSTLREEVRWGTELKEYKERLEKRKTELEAKPKRTKEELKELKTIPKKIKEIEKAIKFGTRQQHRLSLP
jgi:hypothetical protein